MELHCKGETTSTRLDVRKRVIYRQQQQLSTACQMHSVGLYILNVSLAVLNEFCNFLYWVIGVWTSSIVVNIKSINTC